MHAQSLMTLHVRWPARSRLYREASVLLAHPQKLILQFVVIAKAPSQREGERKLILLRVIHFYNEDES